MRLLAGLLAASALAQNIINPNMNVGRIGGTTVPSDTVGAGGIKVACSNCAGAGGATSAQADTSNARLQSVIDALSALLTELNQKTEPANAQTVTGTVNIGTMPAITGAVTATISGTPTVNVNGTVPVSGTIAVSSLPAITGTVGISGTVPVSGTVAVSSLPAVTGTVSISGTPTVAVSGTIPVSGTITASISNIPHVIVDSAPLDPAAASYTYIASATTTVVKSGSGTFFGFYASSLVLSGAVEFFDGTSVSGTKFMSFTNPSLTLLSNVNQWQSDRGLAFTTGLTVRTTGSQSVTVQWR